MLDIRKCPTLVINLDRRPDRWNEFKQQFTLKEFKYLERFPAIDGSKIDTHNDTRISPHTRMNIAKKYRRSDYEINTPGAIGASLSHASCWKHLLDSKYEYLVVFEDDTLVTKEYLQKIDNLIPTLPEWDMWLLGTHSWGLQGLPLSKDQKGWWKVISFTGAHAYVLNRRGAEILLKEVFPIETHIEYYISACSVLKGLRLISHSDLRMKYSMELTSSSDSDTFDSYKSCPVCIVPDNFLNTGLYLSSGTLERAVISISALLIIAYGFYLRR
uniref:Glycosyl transferase family 25 domain-containing protein n=1 Tax=viral metagenome TaxID=1070528 RepID=A0A6C0HES4_9ZZZZ